LNLSDYTQLYAERVPEEELAAEDPYFIQVFHFQNEVNRTHGVPFKFLLIEVRFWNMGHDPLFY
jgi:ubiquitin carboxyl-terminal hydrolase 7